MKILILSDEFPSKRFESTGAVVFELAKGLQKTGHDVFIVTTIQDKFQEEETIYEGLKIFKIYANFSERWRAYLSLYNPQTANKVKQIIKRIKPDVVHAHSLNFYLSYHCLKIAKQGGAKVFLTAHDVMLFHYDKLIEFINPHDFSCPEKINYKVSPWRQIKRFKKRYNPLRNIIIRHYLKYVDKIFAVSRALKKALNDNGVQNVEVIYNALDVNNWRAEDSSVSEFKNRFNLQNKKIILFGGRLSSAKGGEVAVKSLRYIVRQIPNTILLVVGVRNNFSRYMEKLAEESRTKNSLIFTGWLDRKEINFAYAASDVVITPSLCFDAFNFFNLEAMAAGKPVVGTCFGGTPEVVQDGLTGHIVNPFNIEMLAEKVLDFLNNPVKAKKFGQAGRKRAKEHFNMNFYINKTLEYYNGFCKERPRFFLYIFLKIYLLLVFLGISNLPKVKGIFHHLYSRIKNKRGIITLNIHDCKMHIDIADTVISQKLIQYGYWEKGVTNMVKKLVKPGMTIFDLGAHAGYYSLLFSKYSGEKGKVFCFEPNPHNFEILKQNIALNASKNVVLEKLAVSDKNGYTRMFLEKDNLGGHSIVDYRHLKNYIDVKTVKLDDYVKDKSIFPIDLIKMDIECAETLALKGMRQILKENNDIFIIMEFYPSGIIKGKYDPKALFSQLQSFGFNIFIIDNWTGALKKAIDIDELIKRCGESDMNFLCTRRDLMVF